MSGFSGCYGYDDDDVMMLMTTMMTMAKMVTGYRWGTSGDNDYVVVMTRSGCM